MTIGAMTENTCHVRFQRVHNNFLLATNGLAYYPGSDFIALKCIKICAICPENIKIATNKKIKILSDLLSVIDSLFYFKFKWFAESDKFFLLFSTGLHYIYKLLIWNENIGMFLMVSHN